MIDIFHASDLLLHQLSQAKHEREFISLAQSNLSSYTLATRVKHSELDIAFAATGGPSFWVNASNMAIAFAPEPNRCSTFGDILVEQGTGYVNLSTEIGFIPLVDAVEHLGTLKQKALN
ncbi:hypothetical protein OE749_16540 [Aestuariibacter sp. AA17]|uniref:Uncharacterized protein n=1 Tax=Fluctibacter corallii TaxID=2984329 RepID=A0ABT3ACA6_9ALTE|nr:hypothetical protein [Aestuariibacter sp. AA17]MCV2886304.1 hypothetical protein [Aestuariibacter sp. AA17]